MLGVCAGAVSFGASNYMSVFFQDALFVSPTEAGLRSLPLMVGVVASSTLTGRMISSRGYYKRFPVAGSIVATVGLTLLSVLIFNRLTYALFVPVLMLMGLGFGARSPPHRSPRRTRARSATWASPPQRSCSSGRSAGR